VVQYLERSPAFKRVSVEIGRPLVVSLGKALNGTASTFEWLDW